MAHPGTELWSLDAIHQRIAAARAGSLEDLACISSNSAKIPPQAFDKTLNLFNSFLDVPDDFVPADPLPGTLELQYEKVKLCLAGIGSVGLRLVNEPKFSQGPTSSWSKISKWAQHYYIDKCTKDDSEGEQSALLVLSSLFKVSTTKDDFSRLARTDGGFELLAKVWLKATPDIDFIEAERLHSDRYRYGVVGLMHSALFDAHQSPDRTLSACRKSILHEAGNQPSVVAKVALTALNYGPPFAPECINLLHPTLGVIYRLLERDEPMDGPSIFHKALLDEQLIRTVIKTLSYFSAPPGSKSDQSNEIGSDCIAVIMSIMGSKGANVFVPQILELGLLDAIAKYVGSFRRPGKGSFDLVDFEKIIIGKQLPCFLVHYPVISSAIQATNSLLRTGRIKELTSGVLSAEWSVFFDLLLERATMKFLYDLSLKSKDHLVCHNVSCSYCSKRCGISGKKTGIKISSCAGCKVALYCSPECQKSSWKTKNHKLECAAMRQMSLGPDGSNHEGADRYFSIHSTHFEPYLFASDMRRHAPGIQKLRRQSSEFRNAGSDIAYAISYVADELVPVKEISLFLQSSIMDGKNFRSSENPQVEKAKFEHAVNKAGDDLMTHNQMIHIKLYRGGSSSDAAFAFLFKSDFEVPANAVIGQPVGMSNPRRRKARDTQGRELATVWDDIDDIMSRALQEDEAAVRRKSKSSKKKSAPSGAGEEETVFDRIARLADEHVLINDMDRPISPD